MGRRDFGPLQGYIGPGRRGGPHGKHRAKGVGARFLRGDPTPARRGPPLRHDRRLPALRPGPVLPPGGLQGHPGGSGVRPLPGIPGPEPGGHGEHRRLRGGGGGQGLGGGPPVLHRLRGGPDPGPGGDLGPDGGVFRPSGPPFAGCLPLPALKAPCPGAGPGGRPGRTGRSGHPPAPDASPSWGMTSEERTSATVAALLLLGAALLRVGWEARPAAPFFAADTTAYAELVEGVEAAVAAEAHRRTPLEEGERVDPNRDDALEIARLPGVGPALAQRIVDARQGAVYTSPEDLLAVAGIGEATLVRVRPYLDLDRPPEGIPVPRARADASEARDPVDVNLAGVDELVRLNGVGPALAERIVAHRVESGPFRTAEELEAVPGIGPVLLERIRPQIILAGHAPRPP
ncbi:MAG: helix-hairpin-helix domain-containing protein [Gemmatimonadales bacterium]|nr:MAG: helix-hairpin-helix domain-containing protein [Gemmatimonadales bacterium]